MRPAEKLWYFPTFWKMEKICLANSLVGVMISAPIPWGGLHFSRYNFSNIYKEDSQVTMYEVYLRYTNYEANVVTK